jgi:putative hemolysin
LLIGMCLVVSFFLSGMEAGMLASSRLRIRQLMRAGNHRAEVLLRFLDEPEDFLWTILIGNTLANFIAVGLVVVLLDRWLGEHVALLGMAFLAVIFLFYVFVDLLPKMLFRQLPNRLCVALIPPFRFIHVLLSPLVSIAKRISRDLLPWTDGKTFTGHLFGSREEMRLVMQDSAQGLSSEESLMINRVLDLPNLTVQQITIPMANVASLNVQTPMSEALKLARERKVSRLPVWRGEGKQRRVAGLLSFRTLFYAADLDLTRTAGDYLKPALYLEETASLEFALKRMQRSGQRLAIVLGADRREVGIVGLQDILQVIFGKVQS